MVIVRNAKGFSLIEVIAAVIVLEMITLSILGLLSLNNNMTRLNEDRLIVYQLLQRKIEEVRLKNFTTDVTEANFAYSNYPLYRFDVSQEMNYHGISMLKRITMTIQWTSPGGISKQENLDLLVANHQ